MPTKKQSRKYPLRIFNEDHAVYCLLTDCLKTFNGEFCSKYLFDMAKLFTGADQIPTYMNKNCIKLGALLQAAYTDKNVVNINQRMRKSEDNYVRYLIHLIHCPRCLTVILDGTIDYYFTYGLELDDEKLESTEFVDKCIRNLIHKCCDVSVKHEGNELIQSPTAPEQGSIKFREYFGNYKLFKNTVKLDRCVHVESRIYENRLFTKEHTEKQVAKILDKLIDNFDLSEITTGISKTIPASRIYLSTVKSTSEEEEEENDRDGLKNKLGRTRVQLRPQLRRKNLNEDDKEKLVQTSKKQDPAENVTCSVGQSSDVEKTAKAMIKMLSSDEQDSGKIKGVGNCSSTDILNISHKIIQILSPSEPENKRKRSQYDELFAGDIDSDVETSKQSVEDLSITKQNKKSRLIKKRKLLPLDSSDDDYTEKNLATTKQPLGESSKDPVKKKINIGEVKVAEQLNKFEIKEPSKKRSFKEIIDDVRADIQKENFERDIKLNNNDDDSITNDNKLNTLVKKEDTSSTADGLTTSLTTDNIETTTIDDKLNTSDKKEDGSSTADNLSASLITGVIKTTITIEENKSPMLDCAIEDIIPKSINDLQQKKIEINENNVLKTEVKKENEFEDRSIDPVDSSKVPHNSTQTEIKCEYVERYGQDNKRDNKFKRSNQDNNNTNDGDDDIIFLDTTTTLKPYRKTSLTSATSGTAVSKITDNCVIS